MPDISSLSDEQLGVYRELLAKKQGVSGMEKLGGQPPVGGAITPKLDLASGAKPEALKTDEEAQNFWTSPRGLIRGGLSRMGEALPALAAHDPAKAISDVVQGAGSVLTPFAIPTVAAAPVSAGVAALGGLAGSKLGGSVARRFGAPENVEQAASDVGGVVGGAAGGVGTSALSRRFAPSVAKSALGIKGTTEAYGADPGKAVLEETSGVRPASIAKSAGKKISTLGHEMEVRAATAPPGSLRPARDVVGNDIAIAASRNSTATPRELAPLQQFLTEPTPGFQGNQSFRGDIPSVSEQQPASTILGMRRQINNDFISNWNPASNTKGQLGTARRAYGALGNELDRIVPGGRELDQRISSLIPVKNRARLTDLNAGPGERAFDRFSRPTGALAPILFGAHEAGLPGAMGAVTLQEILSSPTAKMILARHMHNNPMTAAPAAVLGSRVSQ